MANVIGIFEAKTKFSEICAKVAESGVEYVVTRRGKEVARIVPAKVGSEEAPGALGILDRMKETERLLGLIDAGEPDFPDVWLERHGCKPSPFADEEADHEAANSPGQ